METARIDQQAQRRARVVEAAMALAAKGGYDAVQMRAVSQEADVALGTIYRYYSSKDQLLVAVLEQLAVDMRDEMLTAPPRGRTPLTRVNDVFQRSCAVLEAEPLLAHAVVTALSSSDLDVAKASTVLDILTAMIHQAVAGEAIDDIDDIVHVLGQVWFASMIGWVSGRAGPGSMAAELELASRLLLRP